MIVPLSACGGCDRGDATANASPAARVAPAASSSGSAAGDSSQKSRPNIVFISIDTLRADHLSAYGYARRTSPNLDQLAADGALFEYAISSTSWTLPSHAAMLTGLVDSVHGATDTDRPLGESRTTLAERLKPLGYTTAGFFAGPYLHPIFGFAQGFDTYVDCTSYADFNTQRASQTGTIEGPEVWQRSQHDVTNPRLYGEVRKWLDARPARPFFVFVHMWDVHFDFVPPPPYDRMFDPDYAGPISGRNFFFNPSVNPKMPRRDLEHLIALYDGEIAWTDEHVGKLIDDLRRLGVYDDTLFVVTADHGTAFFEHGQRAHRNGLWDELVHVPLIMRWPGPIAAGLRVRAQVRTIDILPTVLALLDQPHPPEVMGQSLRPLLEGRAFETKLPAVSELDTLGLKLRSVRRAEYKLIWDDKTGGGNVYDLGVDAQERAPLPRADLPLVQRALDEYRAAVRWLEEYRTALPAGGPDSRALPPEVLQRLRGLGYVGGEDEP